MIGKHDLINVLIRITPEMKSWLEQRAIRNLSTQNSEVVRCILAQMESEKLAA